MTTEIQTNMDGTKRSKKWIIASAIVIVLVLAGGAGVYFWLTQTNNSLVAGDKQEAANLNPEEDVDSDKLLNKDEEFYGTDAYDPDSDNDGYADGEEVSSGFNPLGAGRLNKKGEAVVGEYSGVSLEQVFSGEGSYLCQMSVNQQELPMKVSLKVKDSNIRQEMKPNFSNVDNDELDSLVLIRSGNNVFFGNGENENGWLRLAYDAEKKTWSSPGVTISGGLFVSPEEVKKAQPDKVECSQVDIEASEFIVPTNAIIEPGQSYESFQETFNKAN